MSELTPDQEVRPLSTSQKADIRAGLRAALAVSHAALAQRCGKYQQMYGISYDSLRFLLHGQLPQYLAGVSTGSSQGAPDGIRKNGAPDKHLTGEQAAAFLATYREAFTAQRSDVISRLYNKFEAEYGVSRRSLETLVAQDKRRHAAEYPATRKTPKAKGRNKKKGAKKKSPPLRGECSICHNQVQLRKDGRAVSHGYDGNGFKCGGSGRSPVGGRPEGSASKQVPGAHVVGGGLPTLGRGR
jgi:hypothetical protein